MDKRVLKELKKKIGDEKVFDQKEYLVTYSYDATGIQSMPDVVVFPDCEEDIKNILEIAYKHSIPVTPRGAGVGLSGGSIPLAGGIALCFTKMNKILSIDTENFLAEVEPGVVTLHLQEAVEKVGLFYPPDPASLKTSTIGGNVGENAGGLRCYKYGVTGNYVLTMEAFLPNGQKIKTGSHTIKDVAGYDVKSLLIGSEGTLAVISKITLKLIPLPQHRAMFRIDFKSLEKGAEFINQMVRGNIYPSILEFIDRSSLEAVYRHLDIPLDDQINATVIIEIDGNKLDVEERKKKFIEIVEQSEVIHYKTADTPAEVDVLWSIRRNISPAVSKLKPKKINEDIVVPTSKIPATVAYINQIAKELDLLIVLFGHFGDGNIHTNVMVDPADADEMARAEKALDKIFKYVISLKGSISGEHGIGIAKKPFMTYQFSSVELAVFKSIKQAFDPGNILNPGKVLPES
ncbi:MAG: FAD-binding protein [bacterium]|nr:FAD-binding protein [bacterium]